MTSLSMQLHHKSTLQTVQKKALLLPTSGQLVSRPSIQRIIKRLHIEFSTLNQLVNLAYNI
jgi:hypothetical protein